MLGPRETRKWRGLFRLSGINSIYRKQYHNWYDKNSIHNISRPPSGTYAVTQAARNYSERIRCGLPGFSFDVHAFYCH
jgi:hypothetical protein